MIYNIKAFIIFRLAKIVKHFNLAPNSITAQILILSIIYQKKTMVSKKRLINLYKLTIATELPKGSYVECGVAKGGCLALLSYFAGNRKVWGFDSFEGMPELSVEDEGDGKNWVGYKCSEFEGEIGARKIVEETSPFYQNTTIVKGWFDQSLEVNKSNIGEIAILRLDNDWYTSTKYCLDTLYQAVSENGIIIIDDYHTFIGCRKAVDEFRSIHKISDKLITIENNTEVYWKKTNL